MKSTEIKIGEVKGVGGGSHFKPQILCMAKNLEILDKKMKKMIEVQLREIKKNESFQSMIYKELRTFKDCDYNGIQKTQKRSNNFMSSDDSKKQQSNLFNASSSAVDKEVDEIVKILNTRDEAVLTSSGSHSSRLKSRRIKSNQVEDF